MRVSHSTSDGPGPTRRQLLLGTAALAAGAVVGAPLLGAADATPTPARAVTTSATALDRVSFAWNTVPVAADVGDATRDFSTGEVDFLANNFALLSIEKNMGGNGYADTESAFLHAAADLKAANPDVAVIYYWNSVVYYPKYQAMTEYEDHPSWHKPIGGKEGFDLDNADCRAWWVQAATDMAANSDVDGIFVDALGTARTAYPQGAPALLNELRTSLDDLSGTPRLIYYNVGTQGELADANGTIDPMLAVADGAFYENFYWRDKQRDTDKDDMAHVLRGVQAAAAAHKSVVLKTWPSFSWLDLGARSYADQVSQARADIDFPLAAFLVSAGDHSFLQYSWGYNHTSTFDHGVFLRTSADASTVDPTWYPQLTQALGAPSGPASVNGYVWTRSFARANVTADLENATGTITWL